jgi:Na+/melibiose symporter-like transporter
MPESTRNGIVHLFAWLPLIASVLGILALWFYRLDNATVAANARALEAMKAKK